MTGHLCRALSRGNALLSQHVYGQRGDSSYSPAAGITHNDLEERNTDGLQRLLRKSSYRHHGGCHDSLLHYSSEHGHVDIMRALIQQGANVEARENLGKTALHVASEDAAEFLLSIRANFLLTDETGTVPLHYMAAKGHAKAVKTLVGKKNCDINAKNKFGQTPLHLSCQFGHFQVARLLLDAGTFPEAADSQGMRPLHYAAKHGQKDIASVLLDLAVDADAPSRQCWRPLHYAASEGHVEVTQTLIDRHQSIFDSPAMSQRTPLQPRTSELKDQSI